MRIVVAQAPPAAGVVPGATAEAGFVPLPVGVLFWHDPEPRLTVVVKATLTWTSGQLRLAREQLPLELDRVEASADAPSGRVVYPSDFVPIKPKADVLLVGHGYSDVGLKSRSLRARLTLGALDRSFTLAANAPTDRLPLDAPYLHSLGGNALGYLGPSKTTPADLEEIDHAPGFDYARYNVAAADMQLPVFVGPLELALEGLSPRGPRALELPWLLPRVFVRVRGQLAVAEPPVVIDTVWLDTDAERCVLVFRSEPMVADRRTADRIWVALDSVDAPRTFEEIDRSFARGHFAMAVEPGALDPAAADEPEREAIELARHEAIASEVAAEPALPLERYVAIAAELAEQREPRVDVLGRHGFDEDRWLVEERAWLEAMANRAMEGDGTLANQYGELFVAAQDALAAPDEATVTVEQYAELAAELAYAEEPHKVLERRGTTLATWMRLDRRMRRRAEADPAFRTELAERLERERARQSAATRDAPPPTPSEPGDDSATADG